MKPADAVGTALVTGATRGGIGFGIARHFLSLGASVVIHGRDQAEAARHDPG